MRLLNSSESEELNRLVSEVERRLLRIKAILCGLELSPETDSILDKDLLWLFDQNVIPVVTALVKNSLNIDNHFHKPKIGTVGELVQKRENDLLDYRLMGKRGVAYIKLCLAQHGLALKT